MQRPKFPWGTVIGVGVVIAAGVVYLGIAAHAAFQNVVSNETQAVLGALLIEVGLIAEVIELILGNWWASGGITVSLLVSVTYNYVQAKQRGETHGLTNTWQLLTLAVGPLAAVITLSLTVGFAIRKYKEAEAAYQVAQQKKREELRAKMADEQKQQDEQERQDRLAAEEANRQLKHQQELAKIEAESRERQARIDAETKEHLAAIRAESRRAERQDAGNFPQATGNFPVTWARWQDVPPEHRQRMAKMTTSEIMVTYNKKEKTARNWKNDAIAEYGNGTNGHNVSNN